MAFSPLDSINRAIGSISNADKIINTTINLNSSFLGTIPALSSLILAEQYYFQNKAFLTSGLHRLNQLFLWSLPTDSKSYDGFVVEKSFVPGLYGKHNSVLNVTEKDTTKSVVPTKFDYSFSDKTTLTPDQKKEQYIYVKYEINNTWYILRLRSTIGDKNLRETFQNAWNSHSAFGRSQKNYIYTETERKFPISLYEYAYSKEELYIFHSKIEQLIKLNYPTYENKNGESILSKGTVIYITLGQLFDDIPCIINSMSIDWETNNWDIDEFVPTRANIDMELTIVHDENKDITSQFRKFNYDSNSSIMPKEK